MQPPSVVEGSCTSPEDLLPFAPGQLDPGQVDPWGLGVGDAGSTITNGPDAGGGQRARGPTAKVMGESGSEATDPMELGHVLLTGAAGGIGGRLAAALRAADPDAKLSLVDRHPPKVAAEVGGIALGWDLARPQTVGGHLDALVADQGPVDLLINCAGIMTMRSLHATDWGAGREILDVDLYSPLRLMAGCTPAMVARRRGGVINVSSLAGVVPLRGCAYYGAAKAGLALASEIARLELADAGVHVLTVYPGPVATPLEGRARAQIPATRAGRWLPVGDPEVLAQRIVAAWRRRRARLVFPVGYGVAWRWPRTAGGITGWLSPRPTDPGSVPPWPGGSDRDRGSSP